MVMKNPTLKTELLILRPFTLVDTTEVQSKPLRKRSNYEDIGNYAILRSEYTTPHA